MLALTLGVAACGSDEDGASAALPLGPGAPAAQGGAGQDPGQGGSTAADPTTSGAGAGGASSSEMLGGTISLAGSSSGGVSNAAGGSNPGDNGADAGASLGGSAMVGSGGAAGASGQGGADVGEPTDFVPCPSATTACAIMPLGDSITFGIGSSGGGYRVELFRQALANQQNVTFVGTAPPNGPNDINGQPFPRNHQGHSGFSISGGAAGSLAGLVDAAIDTTSPNIVLLMIGTNDINGNIDVAQAPARLGALLDQITNDAPDALLVVAQIVPTTNPQTNMRVQAYNAAIPGLVQSRVDAGKHIVLVDMFTPFISNANFAGLMNDVLHPNDTGYVVMGQAWHDAIDTFLPRAP